jgi:hypothetical protein
VKRCRSSGTIAQENTNAGTMPVWTQKLLLISLDSACWLGTSHLSLVTSVIPLGNRGEDSSFANSLHRFLGSAPLRFSM